jgi:cytochrome c-type biogenesis protein CcmH/NrfG
MKCLQRVLGRLVLTFTVGLGTAFAFTGFPQSGGAQVAQEEQRAEFDLRQQNFASAAREFRAVLNADPTSAISH